MTNVTLKIPYRFNYLFVSSSNVIHILEFKPKILDRSIFGFIFKALIESFQFFQVLICNGSVKVEPPLDALRHFEKPILGSGSVCPPDN